MKTISRITLNGIVAADDDLWLYESFGYTAFSPRAVRAAIDSADDGELIIEVNSGGGNVFAGFEIFSLLQKAKCRVVAEVQSLAASAASTIISGCDTVRISPVGQIMLHLPSVMTDGNQKDHRDSIHLLNSITDSILNGYESKCAGRATREKLEQLMKNETWLSAREAVDLGLADEIIGDPDASDVAVQNDFSRGMHSIINSLVRTPTGEELRQKYECLCHNERIAHIDPCATFAAACPPRTDNAEWQTHARIDLEKIRFL